jgi:glc operon protein GlcG
MPLTIEEALTVVTAGHEHAKANGWKVSIAVVDEGGLLKALGRMDGSSPLSAQIAEAKAVGSALWYREGEGLIEIQSSRPAFFAQVDRFARLPILPTVGSVLIRRDGAILGAVAGSGATPEQDKQCAAAGLAALGL